MELSKKPIFELERALSISVRRLGYCAAAVACVSDYEWQNLSVSVDASYSEILSSLEKASETWRSSVSGKTEPAAETIGLREVAVGLHLCNAARLVYTDVCTLDEQYGRGRGYMDCGGLFSGQAGVRGVSRGLTSWFMAVDMTRVAVERTEQLAAAERAVEAFDIEYDRPTHYHTEMCEELETMVEALEALARVRGVVHLSEIEILAERKLGTRYFERGHVLWLAGTAIVEARVEVVGDPSGLLEALKERQDSKVGTVDCGGRMDRAYKRYLLPWLIFPTLGGILFSTASGKTVVVKEQASFAGLGCFLYERHEYPAQAYSGCKRVRHQLENHMSGVRSVKLETANYIGSLLADTGNYKGDHDPFHEWYLAREHAPTQEARDALSTCNPWRLGRAIRRSDDIRKSLIDVFTSAAQVVSDKGFDVRLAENLTLQVTGRTAGKRSIAEINLSIIQKDGGKIGAVGEAREILQSRYGAKVMGNVVKYIECAWEYIHAQHRLYSLPRWDGQVARPVPCIEGPTRPTSPRRDEDIGFKVEQ